MDLNIQLSRGDQYIFNEVDGEIVMMNITTGLYVSLNETAKQIWNMLEKPQPLSAVVDALSVEYNVTREQCEKDVLPFIEQLLERGIAIKA
ncbi:MAG: PqqD family protein [Bacteroidetes bacterium]|nr:PqqD family protein [Bacteroidota bacterium]